MNRRIFLAQLRNFCLIYGVQGVLGESVFAAGNSPQRLINFVIKYTGGTTVNEGVGQWTFANTLKPLAPYAADIAIPLGLDSQFDVPMNSHASPQICALSGSMTSFVLAGNTYYPKGTLAKYSSGSGKSIDVLIGESLQKKYKTQLPYLLITNNSLGQLASTHKSSSWGNGGNIIHSIDNIKSLATEIKNKMSCSNLTTVDYNRRLAALKFIKASNNIFSSNYLINKEKFSKVEESTRKNIEYFNQEKSKTSSTKDAQCKTLTEHQNISVSDAQAKPAQFNKKMNHMYDLAILALTNNITRSITFNLYTPTTHATSHYIGKPSTEQAYYDASRFHQASIASFLGKLKTAGLYNNTLVTCNAGSSMSGNVHNYENLSTYIINGGSSGIKGSVNNPKPMGSLLLDVLHKFGITYSSYGGTNHIYGVGKKGGYI